jgi:hypothetical protein
VFRKDLIPFLSSGPVSVYQLARQLKSTPREVAEDLEHLIKSLKRSEWIVVLTPAECSKCGFLFEKAKLMKPGKCPACRSTWIQPPQLSVERKPP